MIACLLPLPANAQGKRPYYAGYQLPPADGLYERWDPRRSWGADHVIAALQEVANRVAFQLPLADPIFIGDISQRGGGRLPGHRTHHIGIDVDIGLFMGDGQQPLGGFVDLLPHELDVASTWVLLTALLDTGQVKFVLLEHGHIQVLRKYALEEVGLDSDTVDEIFPPPGSGILWRQRGVVRHAPNHASHLHVRLTPNQLEEGYSLQEDELFGSVQRPPTPRTPAGSPTVVPMPAPAAQGAVAQADPVPAPAPAAPQEQEMHLGVPDPVAEPIPEVPPPLPEPAPPPEPAPAPPPEPAPEPAPVDLTDPL